MTKYKAVYNGEDRFPYRIYKKVVEEGVFYGKREGWTFMGFADSPEEVDKRVREYIKNEKKGADILYNEEGKRIA